MIQNMPIKQIPIKMLNNYYKKGIFFSFLIIICFCIWIILGSKFAINFIFALFSFFGIVLLVFFLQKRKIQLLIQNSTKEELEALMDSYKTKQEKLEEYEEEFWQDTKEQIIYAYTPKNIHQTFMWSIKKDSSILDDDKNLKLQKQKFLDNFNIAKIKTGAKLFFLPLRLLAYGFLVFGILILVQRDLFDTMGFFSGLITSNILVITYILFSSHKG